MTELWQRAIQRRKNVASLAMARATLAKTGAPIKGFCGRCRRAVRLRASGRRDLARGCVCRRAGA